MRNFISNADEHLKIDGFNDFKWEKAAMPVKENFLQKKIFELESIMLNIKENDGYYVSTTPTETIFGFISQIGQKSHPLISLAYASAWYNSNFGGIYLIGIDNINKEYFAPIKK